MAKSYFDSNAPDIVLRSLFAKYDEDNSGIIGRTELSSLLTVDLGMTNEQAEVYVHLLDKDGDAKVSPDEFITWLRSGEKLQSINDSSRYHYIRKAVDMFKKYDTDGNQSINPQEFHKLMADIGGNLETAEEAFKALDVDDNGKITFPEFLKWLNWVPMDSF